MAENPTIHELLCASFAIAKEICAKPPVQLDWPDDIDGQAQCIRHLHDMATSAGWPYEYRISAFDKLNELAREYGERNKRGSVPMEMFSWCFGVVSGQIERPKRPRKRPSSTSYPYMIRDRLISRLVPWLREQGHVKTKKAAVEQVAKAAGLSTDYVKDILKENSKE